MRPRYASEDELAETKTALLRYLDKVRAFILDEKMQISTCQVNTEYGTETTPDEAHGMLIRRHTGELTFTMTVSIKPKFRMLRRAPTT